MVHALGEARRVLERGSIVIDLRPAIVNRQVGILKSGRFRKSGTTRESFDDDKAANAAVAFAVRKRMYLLETVAEIRCDRVLDSLEEFKTWLSEFVQLEGLPSHEWLLQRVQRVYDRTSGRRRIVIRAPLLMRVLRDPERDGR